MNYESDNEDVVVKIDEDYQLNPEKEYISPIATPLLLGKVRLKALQLVQRAIALETYAKQLFKTNLTNGSATNIDLILCKCTKRGVLDVTKAVKKGIKGLVLIASDVYPLDTISHLPILCEERGVTYAYLPAAEILSATCKSKRPVNVVLVIKPQENFKTALEGLSNGEGFDYSKMFDKVNNAIVKGHPFF